ncbi:MAG: nucleotide sugar dehydrogenase [Bacteroidales bacterium]|jgi:UDP-N-acetyl-D-galactosamine dehydrogenase|nr:nucleotide sugar dehydrogenase [Bacteroidales bacterium]MDD3430768.1 nucleotide sugar dehydrogenase [Bacteroidales bacterium]MDD4361203.1 nucleotide sugar dehydrogenase [Bacteroidales bacterium]
MKTNLHTKSDIRIAVVGLGYVGLPLAGLFSTKYPTIGFDINPSRVEAIMQGRDSTGELSPEVLTEAFGRGFSCSSRLPDIKNCNYYLVCVPTPIDKNNHPILDPLIQSSSMLAKVLKQGDIVIYESTVYPGVTEDICVPVLEKDSGLQFNRDFFVGYSPERVNPGDLGHSIEKIIKVTSGSTPETADKVDALYNSVLLNGTHKASSIRVAEASKIIENAQRDVNIAFINELARMFNAMQLDTKEILDAAATKWNFIRLSPGLVGGHCISVDPYYLIQKAQIHGYLPRMMSDARHLNDGMGSYVGNRVVQLMNKKGLMVKEARILILGVTFKENCPDTRNTKVLDVYNTLSEYTSNIVLYDPHADPADFQKEFGLPLLREGLENLKKNFDVVVLAVAHEAFRKLDVRSLLKKNGLVYDIKSFLPRELVDDRL